MKKLLILALCTLQLDFHVKAGDALAGGPKVGNTSRLVDHFESLKGSQPSTVVVEQAEVVNSVEVIPVAIPVTDVIYKNKDDVDSSAAMIADLRAQLEQAQIDVANHKAAADTANKSSADVKEKLADLQAKLAGSEKSVPFSSKQESADVINPASQLMQKMEDAISMYYDNTTNIIQKKYQSKDVTAAKEKNKAAAVAQFKGLAEQYKSKKDDSIFAAKKDAFEALFVQAQDLFGYESSSDASKAPADSMYSQVSAHMSNFFPAQQKPATSATSDGKTNIGAAGKGLDGGAFDKPASPESTFVSWLNPTRYATPADQSNPAVMKLKEIEAAIEDYYNNSNKWFNKSTGDTKKQADAKTEIERLVAEYNQKLDAKDSDFVAYKSTFEDMIKDAQSQFSNLKLR